MRGKKFIGLVVSITVLLSAYATGSWAQEVKYDRQAKVLYTLGLFQGMNTTEYVPALDEALNREQAVKVILTVLGKAKSAESENVTSAFTDLSDWSKPYIGYAAKNGITKGVSDTLFGAQEAVTGRQLATFFLRALGYEEAGVDLYSAAKEKASQVGIIKDPAMLEQIDRVFIRDDLAAVAYNSLSAKRKGTVKTLLNELVDNKIVGQELVAKAGDSALTALLGATVAASTPTPTPAPASTTPSPAASPTPAPAGGQTPASANGPASAVLKGTNVTNLMVVKDNADKANDDAKSEPATIDGVECKKILQYIYFQVNESYIQPTDSEVTIKVTYYDNAANKLKLQYNTSDTTVPNANYKDIYIQKKATKKWVTVVLNIKDASFKHKQNNGADFRLYSNDDYVSKVEVFKGTVK